jgi:uncharacterized ferritin-like protein (DUF455 family)
MPELYRCVESALLETDARRKCERVAALRQQWRQDRLALEPGSTVLDIDDPGRPERPVLVDPRDLPRRSFASPEGRIRLLHAFAHIEFNAVNIALDAVYRFRDLGEEFIDDWLGIAAEEAAHFELLDSELGRRGSGYGEYPAHAGLWDMVCRTRTDPLHRMALVPRVMEARGLDVSPGMIEKFGQFGDTGAARILTLIYRDEIGHVSIGNRWFERLCNDRAVDPVTTFRELIGIYLGGNLRGPFNREARIAAGFGVDELEALEQGL